MSMTDKWANLSQPTEVDPARADWLATICEKRGLAYPTEWRLLDRGDGPVRRQNLKTGEWEIVTDTGYWRICGEPGCYERISIHQMAAHGTLNGRCPKCVAKQSARGRMKGKRRAA